MAVRAGSAVVLVDLRLGGALPAGALGVLRDATEVYAGSDLPADLSTELGATKAPADLPTDRPVVLIAADPTEPTAAALIADGAQVVRARPPAGVELLAAAAVMDRLRSPGGCPWDAEQTHESLRRYLLEETYELLETLDVGDRPAIREELGDVLLQVLFHARVAAEDPADPFTVDDVAADLVAKLVGRHPHVFAGGDDAVHDAASQEHRWDQLKQVEKKRDSSVDGVPLAQPATMLAAKLTSRTAKAGLPTELLPHNGTSGDHLFALAAAVKLGGEDPEEELRLAGRRFAGDVRAAEANARAGGVDPLAMSAADWLRFWPR